jgi:hypothetical protein
VEAKTDLESFKICSADSLKYVNEHVFFRISSDCGHSFDSSYLKQNIMKKIASVLVLALTVVAFVNAQSKVEVKSNDLPKTITQNITKDYTGFAIENAFKVTNNNESTYEVVVKKGMEKEKLVYNSNGNFLRKEPIEHAMAQKSTDKKVSEKKTEKMKK